MTGKILHWCEVCEIESELTSEEAFDEGWDFPPNFGAWGVVSPRKCGSCSIDETAWWAVTSKEPLTAKHLQTIEKIKGEQK